jgi:hypothetical protein
MAFVPLADRTNASLHVDNTHRMAKDRTSLPSYRATFTPRAVPAARVTPQSSYVHKPYAASVLPETFYSTPIVEPMSSLDVSRESAGSTTSPVAASKAPIRRIYRNGRPVPVFADAPNSSVDSVSME